MYYFSDYTKVEKLGIVLDSWIGTPYSANCRIKGEGVDCAGFVASVMVESGAVSDFNIPFCRLDLVDKTNEAILGKLKSVCDFVKDVEDGDIPIFSLRNRIHLGVYYRGSLYHVHKGISVAKSNFKNNPWTNKGRLVKIGRLWGLKEQ